MPRFLLCPHGHQWRASDQSPDTPEVCPECGADASPIAQGATEARAPSVPADWPRIEGYEVVRELGRGGMGVVYQARQTKLDRLVAVKVLPADSQRGPAFAERFTREAHALARLNHPHIVTVHDFGQADGLSYFVMEYVEGASLRERVREGRLPLSEVLAIVSQVCDALQYAHEEGVMHRDIKPENLLLDGRGRVKVADFGLAKLLTKPVGEHTLTGAFQVLGTPKYMAPEQFENPSAADHRVDLYSLGLVFYEMLTGHLPQGDPVPPSKKVPVDERVDAVVLRALARDPEKRYQRAGEMREAVEEFTRQRTRRSEDEVASKTEVGGGRAGLGVLTAQGEPVEQATSDASWEVSLALAGLFVTGALTCLSAVLIWLLNMYYISRSKDELLTFTICAPVAVAHGIVILLGAVRLKERRNYEYVMLSAILALLPITPAALIGIPSGIWALWVLKSPEVKSAFQARLAKEAAKPKLPSRRASRRFWIIYSIGLLALPVLIGIAGRTYPMNEADKVEAVQQIVAWAISNKSLSGAQFSSQSDRLDQWRGKITTDANKKVVVVCESVKLNDGFRTLPVELMTGEQLGRLIAKEEAAQLDWMEIVLDSKSEDDKSHSVVVSIPNFDLQYSLRVSKRLWGLEWRVWSTDTMNPVIQRRRFKNH